jgi:hypothetical protein
MSRNTMDKLFDFLQYRTDQIMFLLFVVDVYLQKVKPGE